MAESPESRSREKAQGAVIPTSGVLMGSGADGGVALSSVRLPLAASVAMCAVTVAVPAPMGRRIMMFPSSILENAHV